MRAGWFASAVLHGVALAAAVVVLPRVTPELAVVTPVVPIEAVISDVTNIAPVAAPAPLEELAPQPEPEGAALAEAKLEPVAEPIPDPKKPDPPPKPKPQEKPREASLDLDRLDQLLDRSKKEEGRRAPQSAPDAEQGEKPRERVGAGSALTATAEAKIRALLVAKMERCWRTSIDAANPERLQVRVRFKLDRSGALVGEPESLTRIAFGDRQHLVAKERALSAVRACAPYEDLPADQFAIWEDVTLNFTPQGVQ